MDPEDIVIEVRSAALGRLGQVDMGLVNDLKITKRFCNVGSWTMTLPAEDDMAQKLAQKGRGLVVTVSFYDANSNTTTNKTLMSGPVTSFTKEEDADDVQGTYSFIGADDMIHLADALAFPQPSNPDPATQNVSNDIRTGDAETLLVEYVRANIGSNAPVSRHIAGLYQASNLHRGLTVTANARFDQLGKLLGDIAAQGGVGFDLYQDSANSKRFQVYQPVDKSKFIRMDIDNDMLDKTSYGFGAPTGTRFIVAGQGEGTQRQIIQTNAPAQVETDWGRIVEIFKDRRDTADPVELAAEGAQGVADNGKTITSLSVTPSDNVSMVFARDWFLGDIVGVTVDDEELTAVVTEAIISISEDGVLVGATIGDPVGFDYESKLIQNQQSQEQRIAFLEKNSEVGVTEGNTAARTTTYGNPATALARLSLAVTQPIWRNTDTGRTERYYMSISDANGDPIAMANASEYGPGWLDNSQYWGLIGRPVDLVGALDANTDTYRQYNNAFSWSPESGYLRVVRTKAGIVQFTGMMENLTARSAGAVIGNIPIGFRPDSDVIVGMNNSDTANGLVIKANGDVAVQFAVSSPSYMSFENVKYPAAGVATWTNIDPKGTAGDHAFQGGWGNASGSVCRYWKDPSSGLVWLDGRAISSTAADYTNGGTAAMFTIPTTHQAYAQQHMASVASTGFGGIGAGGAGGPTNGVNYKAGGGTSTWISISGCYIVTSDAVSKISWYTPRLMTSSWANYAGSGFTLFALGLCPDGLALSRGLVAAGTLGSRMILVPDRFMPRSRLLMQTMANAGRGRMDIRGYRDWEANPPGAASYTPVQGSNVWFTCDNLSWWPDAFPKP